MAAWTLVQTKVVASNVLCNPTCTIAFDAASTPGNLIVVAVNWNDTTKNLSSCSGDSATGWALATSSKIAALSDNLQFCYGIANGASNVSITFSAGTFQVTAIALEYSGNATSSPLDIGGSATGTSATISAGSFTPATSGELLLVWGRNDSGTAGTWTKGTGWTAIQYNPTATLSLADYQGYGSTSLIDFYQTFSSSVNFLASAVSFHPLAVSGASVRGTLLGVYP